jgi:hypothetical protein
MHKFVFQSAGTAVRNRREDQLQIWLDRLATILAGYVLVNCETMVVGVERVEVEHLLME